MIIDIQRIKFYLAKKIARFYPSSNIIAVAGSVGKSITVQTCYHVLSTKYQALATRADKPSVVAVPEAILSLHSKSTRIILEFSLEYPSELKVYSSIVKPANLVITRIAYEHNLSLGNIEQIFEEYRQLVQGMPRDGVVILNWDDLYCRRLEDSTPSQVIFYGTDPKRCHIWAGNIKVSKNFTYFELNCGVERVNIEFKLIGRHMVNAALAAAALGIKSGLSLFNIKKGLEGVQPSKHRLEVLEGINDSVVLDDTLSSSPASLEEALNVLNEISGRRRVVVIGEMKDLGAFSLNLHKEVARRIFKDRTIDSLLLSGGNAKIIADELGELGYQGRVEAGLSHSQIVAYILRHIESGDLVLVKGDRSARLDEVVERITKQK